MVKYYRLFNKELARPFCFIHPYIVSDIQLLLQQTFPAYVRSVFLFGSSLDLTCHMGSDIDLYFILENGIDEDEDVYTRIPEELYRICRIMKRKYDILFGTEEYVDCYKKDPFGVEYEAVELGLNIYQRGQP